MRILVVSDTHRMNDNMSIVLEDIDPIDAFIHCGDIEGSEYFYSSLIEAPQYMIAGNNDFFSDLPTELEFSLGGKKFFVTHGHDYYVSMGTEQLVAEGRDRGADIVVFGHTHRPCIEEYDDLLVLNPGSLSYPRQEGRHPTYIILDIYDDGSVDVDLEKI